MKRKEIREGGKEKVKVNARKRKIKMGKEKKIKGIREGGKEKIKENARKTRKKRMSKWKEDIKNKKRWEREAKKNVRKKMKKRMGERRRRE